MSLFRAIRELMRDIRNFGKQDLEVLKQQTEELTSHLEKLKALREKKRQFEEQLALGELRRTVNIIKELDMEMKARKLEVEMEAEAMARQAGHEYDSKLLGKVQEALSKLDLKKATSLTPEDMKNATFLPGVASKYTSMRSQLEDGAKVPVHSSKGYVEEVRDQNNSKQTDVQKQLGLGGKHPERSKL